MTLTRPLQVGVYFETPQTSQLSELGLDKMNDIEDYEVRDFTFYEVNAVDEYRDSTHRTGRIHCNGDSYITNVPYDVLVELISIHR